MTSHYDVLGVSPRASAEQIKRAYYRRARDAHPDGHVGSSRAVLEEAQWAMAGLNAAWNVLRDPALRRLYDDALAAAAASAHGEVPKGHRSRKAREAPAEPLQLGSGFHYWMGSSGLVHRDGEGRGRLNLMVAGAKELAPLRSLAPDGLFGLHAAGSPIDDRQLLHLQGITGLQILDLAQTQVTDAGLVHLLGLDRLESISLWNTAVSDAGVALLGRLPNLRHVGLGNTKVSDAGLAGLSSLRHLRVLQLWGTEVSGPGLAHLHDIETLEIVSLPRRVRGAFRRRLRSALPDLLVA
ncbi:MAG: hypothetical protein QOJ09_145 [Actinomycetota bacterium]|nr:hypothetical protein [Actinomycetota bacterium]